MTLRTETTRDTLRWVQIFAGGPSGAHESWPVAEREAEVLAVWHAQQKK